LQLPRKGALQKKANTRGGEKKHFWVSRVKWSPCREGGGAPGDEKSGVGFEVNSKKKRQKLTNGAKEKKPAHASSSHR